MTIAGIPETDLAPKVRQALKMLMDEVQRLREDLRQAQTRVGYLEKLADEDSLVPVANRRAFVRELSRMAAFAERYNAPSSVLAPARPATAPPAAGRAAALSVPSPAAFVM